MKKTDIKKITPYSILTHVVGFEGMFVKLRAEGLDLDKECLWPVKLLPDGVKEGDTFYIRLGNKEILEEEHQDIARKILEDVLNMDLPDFPEDFDADAPFSLSMAEAVKNQADPTEPGQQVTALKSLQLIDELTGISKELDDEWRTELLGEIDDE